MVPAQSEMQNMAQYNQNNFEKCLSFYDLHKAGSNILRGFLEMHPAFITRAVCRDQCSRKLVLLQEISPKLHH